jgi:hypothetical protein
LPLGAPKPNEIGKNFTPPFPAYPSGHATFGAAAFHVTRLFYGVTGKGPDTLFNGLKFVSQELNNITTDNKGTIRPRHERSFPDGQWQMIEETGFSRVFLGVHWAFDAFALDDNNSPDLSQNVGGVPLGLAIAEDIYAGGNGLKKSAVLPTGNVSLGGLYMATTHEDNMQTVLGILLATDGGTTGFTSLQEGYLESVAEQCRLGGGYAVVLARIALDTEVDYSSIDEVCGEADDRSKKEGEASEINAVLVTNPAHDNIAIRWSIPVTDATISLWDMTGRKADEWNIADQKYFNAPVAATPGIYFLQINSQGLVTETHKIIIH